MDCLFCEIGSGNISSKTIYEDETVKVFLDINPSTNGHCLIIPKQHIETIEEVTPEMMTHMLIVIQKMKKLLIEKLACEGLSLAQIGEDVNHFHIHLIPRYKGDNWKLESNKTMLTNIEDIYKKLK